MNYKKLNIVLLLLTLIIGCDEAVKDEPLENSRPETHLFLFTQADLNQQKSKLQVHWWGDDKDGLVVGFIFKWDGIDDNWYFTKSNDSVFALPIGTADTTYKFVVSAIDNSGNGKYDDAVFLNGEVITSEPFKDLNANGIYDSGEPFTDFGAIDESPAVQLFPIKNSSPEITWNDISVLPEKSFPVITVGWNAFDLDGNETISKIHLALNDTTEFITLSGSTRLVSLIIDDLNSSEPKMDVYINADENKLFEEKLNNLKLDDYNRLYLRGVDNSGASSKFTPLPGNGADWYVSKPKGELLIIDDYVNGDQAAQFYRSKFDEFAHDKYDEMDLRNVSLPYESITFQNTLKLFKYIFWYSGSNPRLELTNLVTQNYIQNGGKIAFSLTFQDSSANFEFSTQGIQTFLPIESFDSKKPISFMFAGANIIPANEFNTYPTLKTSSTISFVRTFKVSEITSKKIYDLTSNQVNGQIALLNKTKNLFFIGLPIHQCDEGNNVSELLYQVFVNEFGFKP